LITIGSHTFGGAETRIVGGGEARTFGGGKIIIFLAVGSVKPLAVQRPELLAVDWQSLRVWGQLFYMWYMWATVLHVDGQVPATKPGV